MLTKIIVSGVLGVVFGYSVITAVFDHVTHQYINCEISNCKGPDK